MMTKALQQKLIRSRTSLPPRISSGPIADGNNGNNNNKWNEYICKFIHDLSTIIQCCYPLITIMMLMMAILSYDFFIVTDVLFGLFLLKTLVLDLFLFKMGNIQNWPKKFDMIASTVIVLYAIVVFLLSRTNIQFQSQIVFDIIVCGILTVSTTIAIFILHQE